MQWVDTQIHNAPVAQLDRAPDFESVGRRFESFRAHLINGLLAQLVEQQTLNLWVKGSIPLQLIRRFSLVDKYMEENCESGEIGRHARFRF